MSANPEALAEEAPASPVQAPAEEATSTPAEAVAAVPAPEYPPTPKCTEKVRSKSEMAADQRKSTPSLHKADSKGVTAHDKRSGTEVRARDREEEGKRKEKDLGSEQRSIQDVSQQRSSKLSIGSLSKRQSGEDSKDLFVRRKSTRSIRNAVGSIVSFRRGSIAEYFDRQKTVKFMNTYKLDSDKSFNPDRVTKILKEVLIEALDNLTYDADRVSKQAKWASCAIRAKVKEQEYDRYKIVCTVTIGEKRSQDMFSTYRFLWDVDRDKHTSFVHENMSVYAIACCFGLYYE